jgi:hypothetical protein
VAASNQPADFAEEAAHAFQHPLALDRVRVDDGTLLRDERGGLVDDLGRNPDLADVVEKRRQLGASPLPGGESDWPLEWLRRQARPW